MTYYMFSIWVILGIGAVYCWFFKPLFRRTPKNLVLQILIWVIGLFVVLELGHYNAPVQTARDLSELSVRTQSDAVISDRILKPEPKEDRAARFEEKFDAVEQSKGNDNGR